MRELRQNLREYLGRVEAGERFEVTLFNRPVAELRPVGGTDASLERLIAEGRVTPALVDDTRELPPPVPMTTGITATDALLADRRADDR